MITTWANVRDVLGLAATQQTLVEKLIPFVENDYLRIRNKPWDIGNILTITAGATLDGTVTVDVGGYPFQAQVSVGNNPVTVAAKIAVQIGFYMKVYQDAERLIFPGYLDLTFAGGGTGVTATVSGIDTIYPVGAEHTAIRMIEHLLTEEKAGIQSESLGDWSVTYAKGGKSYPDSIVNSIRRFLSWV